MVSQAPSSSSAVWANVCLGHLINSHAFVVFNFYPDVHLCVCVVMFTHMGYKMKAWNACQDDVDEHKISRDSA